MQRYVVGHIMSDLETLIEQRNMLHESHLRSYYCSFQIVVLRGRSNK